MLFGAGLMLNIEPELLSLLSYPELLDLGGIELAAQKPSRDQEPQVPFGQPAVVRGYAATVFVLDEGQTSSGTPVTVLMWREPTDDSRLVSFSVIAHRDRYRLAELIDMIEDLETVG